jgi:hypothetical protein
MFLSTRQMRRFGELVADVIDDMLAADFEDGFAIEGEGPDEIPGAHNAFREFARTADLLPYDWSIDATVFPNGSRDVPTVTAWERRHARAATVAVPARTQRRRPGQVEATPAACTAPIRTVGGDAAPCH